MEDLQFVVSVIRGLHGDLYSISLLVDLATPLNNILCLFLHVLNCSMLVVQWAFSNVVIVVMRFLIEFICHLVFYQAGVSSCSNSYNDLPLLNPPLPFLVP